MSGPVSIFVSAALASLIVFAALAGKFPVPIMGIAIAWLALCPYTWGLQTGLFFRLFADESPMLLYLMAFPLLYLFARRSWQHGFSSLYGVLTILVCTQALSFLSGADLFAYRTFLSTFFMGPLLLVVFLQEGSNSNPEALARPIVWVTVLIAALSVVERVVQRNPFAEHSPLYISAELVRIAGGTYRPYVSFFHPSEAGTFMALGAPFASCACLQRKSWLSFLGLAIVAAGLLVNATRGAWFGVFVAALLALMTLRNAWLWLSAMIPVGVIAGWIGYLGLKDSPFMMRLINPVDLYIRFDTWAIGAKIMLAHPLLGVGPMNFTKAYADYVNGDSNVFTADNIFVSTMVENGLLALFGVLLFFVFAAVLLRKYRTTLSNSGMATKARFVRCVELALMSYIAIGCFADIQHFRKVTPYLFILVGLGLAEGARSSPSTVKTTALKEEALYVA